jgi:hypothetical protein
MFKFESRFYDLAPLWLEIARTEYEPLVDNIAPESEPPLTWTPPAHPFDDGPGVLVSPGCSHAPEAIAAVRPVPGLAPYLVTKLCGAFQHMHLLPAGRARAELVDAAFAQAHANRLPIALVLGPEEALYLDPDRRSQQEIPVPFSTLLVSGRLKAAREYPQTDELVARQGRLAAVLKALSGGKEAFVFGDLLKGGRPATSEEITRLSGRGPDGVPRGLVLCPTCGLWNGSCLDPESPIEGALLVRVHCSCENDNACARCGELLAEAKLNSNRYKDDGGIWHYAGFMCLSHECGDV